MTPEAALSNDGRGYLELAQNLAEGRFPSLFRTPGYPLFLMLTGGFPETRLLTPLLLQMTLDSLSAVILASIAWRLWNNRMASLLAGLLYAISPVAAVLSGTIMGEALSVFLIVAAFRLALSRPSPASTILQALCWVGTTMVRPFSVLMPLIVIGFLLLRFRKTEADWGRRWKSQAAILIFYAICIAAWLGWNYHRSGMVMICTNPNVAFYIHEIPSVRMLNRLSWTDYLRIALFQPVEYDRLSEEIQKAYARERFPEMNPAPKNLWFTKDDPASVRRIRTEASDETRGRASDLIFIHLTGALMTLRPKWASANLPTKLLEVLRLLLIPIMIITLIWKRCWWPLALFCVWTLYVVLPPGPCGYWRYRMLIEPITSLALACAVTAFFHQRTWKEQKEPGAVDGILQT